jgi:hypothetical protein
MPSSISEGGFVFKRKCIKHYLEERLRDYLALGYTKELIKRDKLVGIA